MNGLGFGPNFGKSISWQVIDVVQDTLLRAQTAAVPPDLLQPEGNGDPDHLTLYPGQIPNPILELEQCIANGYSRSGLPLMGRSLAATIRQ